MPHFDCSVQLSCHIFDFRCSSYPEKENCYRPLPQIHRILPCFFFRRMGAMNFQATRRMLGANFHRNMPSFCPRGRVFTVRGNRAVGFCHAYLRRLGAVNFHATCRMLGAFLKKYAEFVPDKVSFHRPRQQNHGTHPCLFVEGKTPATRRRRAASRSRRARQPRSAP